MKAPKRHWACLTYIGERQLIKTSCRVRTNRRHVYNYIYITFVVDRYEQKKQRRFRTTLDPEQAKENHAAAIAQIILGIYDG